MKEEDKNKECVSMLNEAHKMINEQKELNTIVGVINNDGTLRMIKFEETKCWMSNIRHVGMKNASIQVIFMINTKCTLKEL